MLSMCPLCLPFPLKHPLSLPPCGKTSHFAALLQQILQNLFVGEEQSPKDPVAPGSCGPRVGSVLEPVLHLL